MIEIDDYRIHRKDTMNWCVEVKHIPTKGKNKGNVTWKNKGYYPRFDQACTSLLDKTINESDLKSLSDMAKLIRLTRKRIIDEIKDKCGDVDGSD